MQLKMSDVYLILLLLKVLDLRQITTRQAHVCNVIKVSIHFIVRYLNRQEHVSPIRRRHKCRDINKSVERLIYVGYFYKDEDSFNRL